MAAPDTFDVFVKSVTHKARGIHAWDLRAPDESPLPPFTAGAHIDFHLQNGLIRSYSLCNAADERHRYVVAINRDPASRGGSVFVHDTLKTGDTVRVAPPRNDFALIETAPHTVFIAGGIGITPIHSMILRLEAIGRPWQLHYSTRLRALCAFRDELETLERERPGRVHVNFDHEPGGKATDLGALVAGLARDAHLYCCGPSPMLQAFESATKAAAFPSAQVHVEYFTAKDAPATEGGFVVELARSGRVIPVEPGQTILDTLLRHGVAVPHSCTQGVCATCETRVISGVPDHRDLVLTEAERAAGQTMMICCSGSKTARLILDL